MQQLEALHKAIRKASSAQVWSQGVKLVREGAVTGESADEQEIVLRVKAPGRAVATTVVLHLEDLEWECDCPNSEDTCAHVAAAIISLTEARKQGQDLPTSTKSGGKVRYAFRREAGGLALERFIVDPGGTPDDKAHPLASTLTALTSGRDKGPAVSPEQSDLSADLILGSRVRGRLPADRLENLLTALAGHAHVQLDGEPVAISDEVILPRAVVEDHGGGVRLVIDRDPRITEVVTFGVALCDSKGGKTLHRLGETQLTGGRLENLPTVQDVPREGVHKLLEDTVPALAKRIPVEVRASRMPRVDKHARPEIVLDLTHHDGHRLSVLPTLVYVDPAAGTHGEPLARVDAGRLVHLRGPVPVRDEAMEKHLILRLRDQLNLVPGQRVTFEGKDAVGFQQRLKTWRGEVTGDVDRERFWQAPPLEPRVEIQGDRFDIVFESPAGNAADGQPGQPRRADAEAVLRAWREGDGLVPLDGGGWAPVPAAWLAQHGHRVADLLAARDQAGRVPLFALPDLGRLCADLDQPPPPGLTALKPLVEDFTTLPASSLPADLTATLRHYQQVGVDWLSFLRNAGMGAVLADDMGLGKTLQALCAIRGKTLVVCPTSVIHNWASEIQRFRPGLRAQLYHGPRRSLDADADVVLTTYSILRLDIDELASRKWDTLVVDEAQNIKNPDSQVARAAYRLEAGFRVALSGTPVENRLDELWSLFHVTNRGLLGGRSDFKERYAEPVARGDAGAAARLRERIRPFLLRRLKREVAPELPPRTESLLYCELDERERAVYEAVRAASHREVLERLAQGGSVLAALEALLRLRQAACHPALVPGQRIGQKDGQKSGEKSGDSADQKAEAPAESSSKVSLLIDALELAAADDHKALVFSQWTSLLDLIEPHLRASGIGFTRLDGSTRDRAGVVASFQDPAGPPVLLVSLKAGGTGLNLTAADHVFLCDPWWNPAVEDQAADRAHRIGQDRPVMVYRLVAKDTVEERILALQERKRALADAALGEADRAASLTREDLLALLA